MRILMIDASPLFNIRGSARVDRGPPLQKRCAGWSAVRQSDSTSTAADLIRDAAGRLSTVAIETARLDAEVLLRHVLGTDRTHFFMRLQEPITIEEESRFRTLVERRAAGEPVAYLTGVREFMGVDLTVGPGVLIPRPETELIVEWAMSWLAGKSHASVVDVGTGSGAIILSLATVMTDRHRGLRIGCDRSPAALAFALYNRRALGLEARVGLVRGDLLTWLGQPVDLILANLPYLTPEQLASNPELQAEPEIALVSGPEGAEAIEDLLADVPRVLKAPGAVVIELDPSQAARIAALATLMLPDAAVSTIPDLAGLNRFVVAERG